MKHSSPGDVWKLSIPFIAVWICICKLSFEKCLHVSVRCGPVVFFFMESVVFGIGERRRVRERIISRGDKIYVVVGFLSMINSIFIETYLVSSSLCLFTLFFLIVAICWQWALGLCWCSESAGGGNLPSGTLGNLKFKGKLGSCWNSGWSEYNVILSAGKETESANRATPPQCRFQMNLKDWNGHCGWRELFSFVPAGGG